RDRVANRGRELDSFALVVVLLEDAARGLTQTREQRTSVVFERSCQTRRRTFDARATAPLDLFGHGSPQTEVLLDHPVDQVLSHAIDPLRSIAHHYALEFLAEQFLAEEVDDSSEAQRRVKVLESAHDHLIDDVLHLDETESEIALHIFAVGGELRAY